MPVRFQVLSDLHIDSYARRDLPIGEIPYTNADAILVAGDTSNGLLGIEWLIGESKRLEKPIFVIVGNHEYFGHNILELDAQIKALTQDTQVHFLQCASFEFMGVRIIGTTLWTDYQYQPQDNTLEIAQQFMRDYREIYYDNRLLTPQDTVAIHQQQRAWLQNALKQSKKDAMPTVVMTHHSISPLSIAPKYANFPSNAGFVVDLSEWLKSDFAPDIWLHGHTHEAFDYQQGHTRVIVNPRAYPNEISSTGIVFDWHKVIEVMV